MKEADPRELVLLLARALVDQTDQVRVDEVPTARGAVIQLTVAPEDIGKVIGKDGRTAQALRTLLSAATSRNGRRVQLDILD
jgi:uncharacterized protein